MAKVLLLLMCHGTTAPTHGRPKLAVASAVLASSPALLAVAVALSSGLLCDVSLLLLQACDSWHCCIGMCCKSLAVQLFIAWHMSILLRVCQCRRRSASPMGVNVRR